MNHIPQAEGLDFAAMVSYLPDPLGSYVRQLRRKLPGEHHPEPHITILPPRPLSVSLETAARQARAALQSFRRFAVELAAVRAFPETNVLYIDVEEGSGPIRDLHDALHKDALAGGEQFEFRPHITLSGPIPEPELPGARRLAENAWNTAGVPRRFVLGEVAFLWRKLGNGDWTRLWSQSLKPAPKAAAVTARTY